MQSSSIWLLYLLIPWIFIGFGVYKRKFPAKYPPEILGKETLLNGGGYRTPTAMKNKKIWFKAQHLFAVYFIGSGIVSLPIYYLGVYLLKSNVLAVEPVIIKHGLLILFVLHILGNFVFCELRLRQK